MGLFTTQHIKWTDEQSQLRKLLDKAGLKSCYVKRGPELREEKDEHRRVQGTVFLDISQTPYRPNNKNNVGMVYCVGPQKAPTETVRSNNAPMGFYCTDAIEFKGVIIHMCRAVIGLIHSCHTVGHSRFVSQYPPIRLVHWGMIPIGANRHWAIDQDRLIYEQMRCILDYRYKGSVVPGHRLTVVRPCHDRNVSLLNEIVDTAQPLAGGYHVTREEITVLSCKHLENTPLTVLTLKPIRRA